MKHILQVLSFSLISLLATAQTIDSTYAEKLGFPKGAKVVILHVDDVGMSWDSNEGAIAAMTKGVATSCSVMMPCAWVPGFVHYLSQHPEIDAGLHLTLTSEWRDYRWSPLSGIKSSPGLVDKEGALWPSVEEVVSHATADEVEMEIRLQVERALKMGFKPTHLDSHMGTLFASAAFMERYMKVGMDYKIPIMFPAGHATVIKSQSQLPDAQIKQIQSLGKLLWTAGLPVLDDLHNTSYGWSLAKGVVPTDDKLRALKTANYIDALKSLKPGLTMVIMHCTAPSAIFEKISDSGPSRKGDMLAMLDPALRKAIKDQNIILTTWREVGERRKRLQ